MTGILPIFNLTASYMISSTIRLPDGQTFTVQPVFAGLFFKSHELNTHPTPFPIGWTIVLHTEDDTDEDIPQVDRSDSQDGAPEAKLKTNRPSHMHSFTKPTLQGDSLFISSISNPSSSDFKPAASPTRQIAMIIWITLYWYFHQPAPSNVLPLTAKSMFTAEGGRPRGEWRINIKRDGVLRGRNLLPKLERMGLIASLDSAVGMNTDDAGEEWAAMYVSKQMFWQIPSRLFLFTLQPTSKGLSSYPGSPVTSRSSSPVRNESSHGHHSQQPSNSSASNFLLTADLPGSPPPQKLASNLSFPIGPYSSSSHLPTYYPPGPLQYNITNGVRHPVRPKPPRMGEVFYSRFVPSTNQYLSFRVASSSPKPVPYFGPIGPMPAENTHLTTLSDTSLVQMWLSNPRVSKFWGGYVPDFLTNALMSKHSFPVIGMWDGVPFGWFEIYWVKEDILGRYIGPSDSGDWDRGLHVFVGEEWARGRVQSWLSALVHWMFCADYRTMSVCIEPRVDNQRFIQLLQNGGFVKEKEVSFPHKQSWFGRLRRENWEGLSL